MNAFIEFYMTQNKSKSDSTKISMENNIKRLEKLLKKSIKLFHESDFQYYHKIFDLMTSEYSDSTCISTCYAIVKWLEFTDGNDLLIIEYLGLVEQLKIDKLKTAEAQKKTEHEQEVWIDYPEMKDKVEHAADEYLVKQHSFTQYRNFIMLSLFTLQPPARLGNYLNCRVIRDMSVDKVKKLDNNFNYIIIGENAYVFVFNNYKTSGSIGQVVYHVENDTLTSLLDLFFSNYNDNFDYFLTNANGVEISQSNFTHALGSVSKRILGKEIRLNDIRHIFLTWFESINPSIKDKKTVLELVGHKYKSTTTEKYARHY